MSRGKDAGRAGLENAAGVSHFPTAPAAASYVVRSPCGNRGKVNDPLGFANAMAGLPFVEWRQSSTRCARFAKPISGLVYQQFLIVATALRNCPRSRKDILRNIKAEPRKSPKQSALAHAELRRKWLYMLRSVEQTNPSKEVGAAIAYRICARFEQNKKQLSPFELATDSEYACKRRAVRLPSPSPKSSLGLQSHN